MKTIGAIILLALINLSAVVAQGQGPGQRHGNVNRGERIAQEKERVLAKVTDLSDDQKMLFDVIYDDYQKAFKGAFDNIQRGDREGNRAKMDKIRTDKDEAIKDIFSAEQFVLYKQAMGAGMQQRRRRANG